MFTPEYIAYVTTIPSLIGDYDYFKAFTDVLFNENDFDLVVGEDSAKSTFSEAAMSPYTVNPAWYDFAGGEAMR